MNKYSGIDLHSNNCVVAVIGSVPESPPVHIISWHVFQFDNNTAFVSPVCRTSVLFLTDWCLGRPPALCSYIALYVALANNQFDASVRRPARTITAFLNLRITASSVSAVIGPLTN
jgi:hypothetical protein